MGSKKRAPARDYRGYEDYSMEGRAEIDAFNKAGGPAYLRPTDSRKGYDKAARAADEARTRAAVARGGSGGPPHSRRGPDHRTGDMRSESGYWKLQRDLEASLKAKHAEIKARAGGGGGPATRGRK